MAMLRPQPCRALSSAQPVANTLSVSRSLSPARPLSLAPSGFMSVVLRMSLYLVSVAVSVTVSPCLFYFPLHSLSSLLAHASASLSLPSFLSLSLRLPFSSFYRLPHCSRSRSLIGISLCHSLSLLACPFSAFSGPLLSNRLNALHVCLIRLISSPRLSTCSVSTTTPQVRSCLVPGRCAKAMAQSVLSATSTTGMSSSRHLVSLLLLPSALSHAVVILLLCTLSRRCLALWAS